MTFLDHKDHEWELISPCVYCKDCGIRLYHGGLPESQQAKEDTIKTLDSLPILIGMKSGEIRSKNYGPFEY